MIMTTELQAKSPGREELRMLLFVKTYLASLYLNKIVAKDEAVKAVADFDEQFPDIRQVPLRADYKAESP